MSTDGPAHAKFGGLAVGARFRWRNATYVKISPLIARDETSGAAQMVQRAALVEPLGVTAAGAAKAASHTERVFEEYHCDVVACFEAMSSAPDARDFDRLRQRLEEARRRALDKLGKPG
ncbi:MAG: hypothetical protein WCZ87_00820 [Thiohalobacteraceae bacterium]